MKRSVVAALGAAMIATLGASSAAQAATIDFGVVGIGGTIVYHRVEFGSIDGARSR